MNLGVQLTWYRRSDDSFGGEAELTQLGLDRIADILEVPEEDLVFVIPLDEQQLAVISNAIGIAPDVDTYEYFVAGYAAK